MAALRRGMLFVLAGLFVFNLIEAITVGGRGNWITVVILALLFALTDWRRRANR